MNLASLNTKETVQQQDTIKTKDSVGSIGAMKLIPASKIESSDGAIIPKEAIALTKLEPAFPSKRTEEDSMVVNYMLIGVAVILLIILVKFISKKMRKPTV